MRNSARASQTGYSLIEILLVVVLLATVSLAITASFFQGVKVYSRFNGALDEEGKAIFMARLTRDLKNSANYSLIPWSVSDNSLSFASVTGVSGEGFDICGGLPVRVVYRFDPEKKTITRLETAFPFNSDVGSFLIVAENVESLKFKLLRDSEEAPPSRVTVLVEYGESGRTKELKKHIMIPSGYAGARNR